MIVVLYCFTMELKNTKNINSYKHYITSTDKREEYKEKLFTQLYKSIIENTEEMNIENVTNYLKSQSIKYTVDDMKGIVKYDESSNHIIFESYNDNYSYRRDTYDYDILDNKLKFIYIETVYIEGRIN